MTCHIFFSSITAEMLSCGRVLDFEHKLLLNEHNCDRILVGFFFSLLAAGAHQTLGVLTSYNEIKMKECHVKIKGRSSVYFILSWVVFEEPGFCGESYVLEKGLYGSPEDWGALQYRVGSTMPVLLVRAMTNRVETLSDY